MKTKVNPDIFREYDIRGIAGIDFTDSALKALGCAIGTYLKRKGCKRLTLGRDCRMSSSRLRDGLCEALSDTGLHIMDLGVCPTPLLYFSLYHLKPDGGVMITGSHNPPEYNGFKVALGKSTIYGQDIQEIRQILESGDFDSGKGGCEVVELLPSYRCYLLEALGNLDGAPRVVVDSGNGTASLVAPQLYRDLGCEVVELYSTMDGKFPNHHPDPTVIKNMQDLIQKVQETRADLGIAFDGDADRIGVVDDQGNILWGDYLMILYSREILRENPGSTIIGEVKCSQNLYDDIRKHGGRGVMWKAGHSLIKAKMKKEKAVLGGEMSGHIFFADRYFGYDDAIYAGARLLEILSKKGQSISKLLSDVPRIYNTPEIRVDCPDQHKFEVVRRALEFFGEQYETIDVDGVRVQFDDGWGLVRASNTQPILVSRFEAQTNKRLKEIQSMFEVKVKEFIGCSVGDPFK